MLTPQLRLIASGLAAVGPLLQQICNITGTPGLSVGVLHDGEVIHTANYGFRNLENQLPPDEETSWLVCSITKSFTAAMIGMMVDEGKIDFTTPLREILPEFHRQDAQADITIQDLLSMRTGIAPYDGLWLSSNNQILLDRSEAIPIFNYAPVTSPLRTEFHYNNIAFEILGQILEKVSGLSYQKLLRERIVKPLSLNRTFYAGEPFDHNTATPYAVFSNRSYYEIPPWGYGEDLLIGSGGAIRSSVSDMLVLYKALMSAASNDINLSEADINNPFKQVPELFTGKVGLPGLSLLESSYASGWIRNQLPGRVDLFADYWPPILGEGSASRLMVHHSGYIAGNVGHVALFPETTSAVIVLGNSAGLTDTMRLLSQILVEVLFDNDFDSELYLDIARDASQRNIEFVGNIKKALLEGKTVSTPSRPLTAYVGRYYNSIGNFFIEIKLSHQGLQVAYMGSEEDAFYLEPYQDDSFFWWLNYDEMAKRARLPQYPKDYFIIKFECPKAPSWWNLGGEVVMDCVVWKHEFTLAGDGETFRKHSCPHSAWDFGTGQNPMRPKELR